VLELGIAQEDEVRELLGQGPRWPDQAHPGFTQQAISFPAIAAAAGDDLVLPAVGGPASRGGHHVVDGQLGARHCLVAVLARPVIAQQKVATVGPKHPSWDLDVGQEADDDHVVSEATPSHCLLDRPPRIVIDEGDALLGEQDDKPPLTDDVKRLK